MPNRRVHDLAVVNVSFIWILYTIYFAVPFGIFFPTLFGMLLGVFVNPDLDIAEKLRGWWGFIWKIYGKLFRHRGISHFPVFGTLTRVIYIMVPSIVVFYFLGIDFWDLPHKFLLFMLAGLCVSDIIHLCLDLVF